MVTAEKALEYLLDRDGSTRDVTFTPVSRDALCSWLNFLAADYRLESAHDNDGQDVLQRLATSEFDAVFKNVSGYVHATLSSKSAIVRFLQIFVDWSPDDSGYCLELSFFPDDVALEQFTIDEFLALLQQWNERLRANDYFVRYENAGWTLYDSGGLGVIFTRKLFPRPDP